MPVQVTYPGVYIEEIPSGVQTITGVATSITAFMGRALSGPLGTSSKGPITIFSFADYERIFGGLWSQSPMSYAVRDFFLNGGSQAVIVRLVEFSTASSNPATGCALINTNAPAAPPPIPPPPAVAPAVAAAPSTASTTLPIFAANPGTWGNWLRAMVDTSNITPKVAQLYRNYGVPQSDLFNLTILYNPPGGRMQTERFVNLTLGDYAGFPPNPNRVDRVINQQSQLAYFFNPPTPLESASQVVTATVAGTITTAGDATVTFTAAGMPHSPKTISVPVAAGDTAEVVAGKMRAALSSDSDVGGFFRIGGSGAAIIATARTPAANDATMNIDIAPGTSAGLTAAPTSTITTPGVSPGVNQLVTATITGTDTITTAGDATVIVKAAGMPNSPKTISVPVAKDDTAEVVAGKIQKALSSDPDVGGFFTIGVSGANITATAKSQVADTTMNINIADGTCVGLTPAPTSTITTAGVAPPIAAWLAPWTTFSSSPNLAKYNQQQLFALLSPASGGDDGQPIQSESTYDDPTVGGIAALDKVDLFNLLCIPYDTAVIPNEEPAATQAYPAVAQYCQKRRAMFIVDPPYSGTNDWSAFARKYAWGSFDPSTLGIEGDMERNAAVYFPRVVKADPLLKGQARVMPACGIIAGVMASTDASRGVWKAPAGIDAALNGILNLDVTLTDEQNGMLNPLGINCLRSFPVIGPVVWGARTLRGADQLEDDYKYIPVRRLTLYIEESLYRGTKWAVFEPNADPLWTSLRLSVNSFLSDLQRQGAFYSYFVQCDNKTTTPDDIALGIVNVIVGIAPVKPAEFVIIQIQQTAGQTS
jgi:phage tail sheath protein FI